MQAYKKNQAANAMCVQSSTDMQHAPLNNTQVLIIEMHSMCSSLIM